MSAARALAADMPLPPPPSPPPEFLSGWYARGDLGVHWGVINGADSAAGFPDPFSNKLNQGVTGGLGVGIKTQWLRSDVTVDYVSPLKYQGAIAAPGDTTAKIQSTAALFNGYLDLGTWYRAIPYIGGGLGAAYTRVSGYSSAVAPPFSNGDRDQWGFAWAAMAGVAYPVSHNLLVDLGYRYLDVGNVTTGSDAVGRMSFKNVAGHEVRLGLRWSFDDLR